MLKEFKEFALKGHMLDMAIGIIIGAAFGKIVTSLVNDILMPPIGLVAGRLDFSNLFLSLSGSHATLAEATQAGAPVLRYGLFLNALVDFLIVAFVLFLIVRQVNRFRARSEAPAAAPAAATTTKECPYCFSTIPLRAVRCAHCTSELAPDARSASGGATR